MSIQTISPVDQSVVIERTETSLDEVEQVFARSRQAFKSYAANIDLDARIKIAAKFLNLLEENSDMLSREITLQMGRPLRYTPIEIRTAISRGRYMLKNAKSQLADVAADQSESGIKRFLKKVPKGPCLVIGAWNYPWLITMNAVLPALVAGNTVVLKGSPQTPLCSERFTEFYSKAGLPEGVLQYIHVGNIDLMKDICQQPEICHICFTGSVNGGREVERASVMSNRDRFIDIGLELGGKDPAYVRADADVDYAAVELVDGATFSSGQSCCAVERIYVHDSIYDRFVSKFVAETKKHVLGNPLDSRTTLGPVVSLRSAYAIRAQIDDAVAKGAKAMLTKDPLDTETSTYVTPQVLTGVNHNMDCMTEETFGPIVGIQRVADDEEAIELMNNSKFGLTASIWSSDSDNQVEILLDRVHAGTVFCNRSDYPDPSLAWTGRGLSGRGVTLSAFGFDQFYHLKSYHLKTVTAQ